MHRGLFKTMQRTYKQITFRENEKRIKLLENFKLHLTNYLDNMQYKTTPLTNYLENLQYKTTPFSPLENEIAKEEHKKISKLIDEACSYIDATSKDSNNCFCLKRDLPFHDENILHRKYICETLINNSEKAIAIYKKDSRRAKQRTYNPFFWIILLIDYLSSLLFGLLNKVFPSKEGIEFSRIGIFIKWMLRVIFVIIVGIVINYLYSYLQIMGYAPNP